MHLSVAILRLEKGLDYSHVLGESLTKEDLEASQNIITNMSREQSFADKSQIHDSNDSLNKTISQGKACFRF